MCEGIGESEMEQLVPWRRGDQLFLERMMSVAEQE